MQNQKIDPKNAVGQFADAWTRNKTVAATYLAIAIFIYGGLFILTGSVLSGLTGWSFWPSVGLVFLLRMCFT